MNKSGQAYLDWISAAPVLPEVQTAIIDSYHELFGNPSSRLHPWGVKAQRALDRSRASITKLIGGWDPVELIFCASASEANNLAVKGIATASERGKHIVIGGIEHMSVRMAADRLRWSGFSIDYAPVTEHGTIKLDVLKNLLRDDTALVSIQHANTEIGTIQPIAEIAAICNEREIPLHCDGWGTAGILPVSVADLGVSAYTIGANGFWGAPGAAALWIKKSIELNPLIDGGGQELKRRAGTENLPAIVGMGIAAEIAMKQLSTRSSDLQIHTQQLLTGIGNGLADSDPVCFFATGHPVKRLPQIASFRLEWIEGEALLLGIGSQNVAAVSGSACARPELGASYVLAACKVAEEHRNGGITLSVGWSTTAAEIEYATEQIVHQAKRLFAISPMAK